MNIEPIQPPVHGPSTAPRPFVFVLMPFAPEFRDVYAFGIRAAAEAVGAYAERVDEQHFTDSILGRILNQISKADAIIADMTGRNPNVYYEVGYAHAFNKPVLLITRNIDDIPFDLKDKPHTHYVRDDLGSLTTALKPKLRAALSETGKGRDLRSPCPIELRINGVVIPEVGSGDRPTVPVRYENRREHFVHLGVSMCNTKSPLEFNLDRCFVLSNGSSTIGTFGGPNARATPDWVHNPGEENGVYVNRFKVDDAQFPVSIPYFDVHQFELLLFIGPTEPLGQIRLELLADGRRYFFDFVSQLLPI